MIILPGGDQLTPDSIERALDMHAEAGLITRWHNWHEDRPGRKRPLYTVVMAPHMTPAGLLESRTVDLATLHEAHAFIAGLVSADNARPAHGPGRVIIYGTVGLPVIAGIPLGSGTHYACVVTETDGRHTALTARQDGAVWRADMTAACPPQTYADLRDALRDMVCIAEIIS
jgi:hypothetical protein